MSLPLPSIRVPFPRFGGQTDAPRAQVIEQARIVTPTGDVMRGDVLIIGDRIAQVTEHLDPAVKSQAGQVIRVPEGTLLTPGLVEQHFHGGYGVNFNLSGVADMQVLLEKLPAKGITRVIPTVMTGSVAEMETALRNLEQLIALTRNRPGVQIEGIHLEGPFINTLKRGAHDSQLIDAANQAGMALVKRLLAVAPHIRLVTLAPELDPNGRIIRYLTARGIRVNAGHTNASKAEMEKAVRQGVTGLTHTFNAMNGIHHRTPGPIPVAISHPSVYPEIIADGHHVDPTVVGMMRQSGNRLITVSDSMALAGLPEGSVGELGGQPVHNRQGAAVNAEGNLAGSTVFVTDCVRNLVRWGLMRLQEAVQTASRNPADFLGLAGKIGRIMPGHAADLVLWDEKRQTVLGTWINGQLVYRKFVNKRPSA